MDWMNRETVRAVLDGAHDLTLATVRPDGYPQATTISFAHDGLTIYAGIGRHSQKAENIRHNRKVSLTVNLPYRSWDGIRGVSMAAHAELLDDPRDVETAGRCLLQRFPEAAEWSRTDHAAEIAFIRITPELVSVLDYSKGFGHTELCTV